MEFSQRIFYRLAKRVCVASLFYYGSCNVVLSGDFLWPGQRSGWGSGQACCGAVWPGLGDISRTTRVHQPSIQAPPQPDTPHSLLSGCQWGSHGFLHSTGHRTGVPYEDHRWKIIREVRLGFFYGLCWLTWDFFLVWLFFGHGISFWAIASVKAIVE